MDRTQFKTDKLRGKIVEKYGSVKECAKAAGISAHTMSDKMNGTTEFRASEIYTICGLLGIKAKDMAEYFLEEK